MGNSNLHIVSVLDIPDLEQKIRSILPSAQVSILTPEKEIPADLVADVLLVHTRRFDNVEPLLSNPNRFKWVHVYGAGVDHYGRELVGERILTSAVGATSLAIAEWAMAMILSAAKDVPNNWVKEAPQKWFATQGGNLAQLQHARLGLLGFGNIGRKIAQRALGFEMKVKSLVRNPRQSDVDGVEFVNDLESLLKDADHLVLCVPETPQTHHILNETTFARCKPGMHLINVARGGLIDEQALLNALESGQVGLASLDVAEKEPVPAGHWMYSHPRVRLSPHVSWNSSDAFDRLTNRFLENLKRYSSGEPLLGRVDFNRGY